MKQNYVLPQGVRVVPSLNESREKRNLRILPGNVIRINARAMVAMQKEKNRLTGKTESLFEANEIHKEIVNPEFI